MKSFDFFFHFRHLAEANDVAQLRNRSTADGVAFFFSFHFFLLEDNLFYFVFIWCQCGNVATRFPFSDFVCFVFFSS